MAAEGEDNSDDGKLNVVKDGDHDDDNSDDAAVDCDYEERLNFA
jgi:hypothetical protein